jgi:hypothetical protein
MARYTLEYKIDGQRKWRALSVSKLVPFTKEEGDQYRHMVADRQAPKAVMWHQVSLRMLKDGEPVTA